MRFATTGPRRNIGRLLEAVDRRELSPVMHLPDELELRGLGQTGEHDVQVDIVGDFLHSPLSRSLRSYPFVKKLMGSPP